MCLLWGVSCHAGASREKSQMAEKASDKGNPLSKFLFIF